MRLNRHFFLIVAIVAAVGFLASCHDDPLPIVEEIDRTIIYAVNASESRQELKSEDEWDQMLDRFCDLAREGKSVTFFNAKPATKTSARGYSKDTYTFSTTDRVQMKNWMKEMEKEGRTVTVSYDDASGTWNGTAYTSAPHPEVQSQGYTGTVVLVGVRPRELHGGEMQVMALEVNSDTTLLLSVDGVLLSMDESEIVFSDGVELTVFGAVTPWDDINGCTYLVLEISNPAQGSVMGRWEMSCLVQVTYYGDDVATVTAYMPEMMDESLIYEFDENGNISFTYTGNGRYTTRTGTWSISEGGKVCCDLLLPKGGCWDINWLTDNTMILSTTFADEDGSPVYCQMELSAEEG